MNGLDDETFEELTAPYERIRNPRQVALKMSAMGLVLFGGLAAIILVRNRRYIRAVAWEWVALIPVGIVVGCSTYAYLGALVGRRTARRVVASVLALLLLGGIYALTRYLDSH